MSREINLKEAERKVFTSAFQDGLVDIGLGCFFLQFAIAPFLSSYLGDFWSSAVFVPVWAAVLCLLWLVRRLVVRPRIGTVRFGLARKTTLAKFLVAMLVVNVIAFILGLVAAMSFGQVPGQLYSIIFGMILLAGFTIAAYFLDFSRLYIYGLLVGFSPLVGEWLWTHGYATHHGFPITFGTSAGIMILVGLAVLMRLVHTNPVPTEGTPSGEA